jgi:hypothetical protein
LCASVCRSTSIELNDPIDNEEVVSDIHQWMMDKAVEVGK